MLCEALNSRVSSLLILLTLIEEILGLGFVEIIKLGAEGNKRQKRASSQAEKCVFSCMKDMSQSETWDVTRNSNGRVLDSGLLEREQLDKFCELYRSGKQCIKNCGNFKTTHLALATLKPFDYLCITHYEDLVNHLDCFKRSEAKVKTTCDSRCGGPGSVANLQREQEVAIQSSDFPKLSNVMGKMCRQMDCETRCQEPVIMRECRDPEAARYMRTFAQESLLPLQEMVEKMGGEHLWPEGCRRLTMSAPSSSAKFLAVLASFIFPRLLLFLRDWIEF